MHTPDARVMDGSGKGPRTPTAASADPATPTGPAQPTGSGGSTWQNAALVVLLLGYGGMVVRSARTAAWSCVPRARRHGRAFRAHGGMVVRSARTAADPVGDCDFLPSRRTTRLAS